MYRSPLKTAYRLRRNMYFSKAHFANESFGNAFPTGNAFAISGCVDSNSVPHKTELTGQFGS